jgi:hypothetical protein
VAGADQDGVDRVAFGAGEAVAIEKPVAFCVTDDRFNGAASPQLPLDCRRSAAGTLGDVDSGGGETVSAVSFVDIDAGDRHAGQPFDLGDLLLQRVAVVREPRKGLDSKHELTAVGARIGDGDGRFDAKFIARARLALGDAFDLRRMQGVDLVLVVGLSGILCAGP